MKSFYLAVAAKSFQKNDSLMNYLQSSLKKIPFNIKVKAITNLSEAKDAQAILLGKQLLGQDELKFLKSLKVVSKYGVGLDNVSLEPLAENSVDLLFAPGVNASYVAEHALGLTLSLLRGITHNHHKLNQGVWHKNGGSSLFRKKVFIIGLGAVGLEVARLFAGFDCELGYHDIRNREDEALKAGCKNFSLHDGLKWCDIATLHVSKNPSSLKMISSLELSFLKDKVLINTSRGGVIHQEALLTQLKSSNLRAALDVFESEPLISDHEFMGLENIVLTPHTAANSVESQWAMGVASVDLLCEWFQGNQL